MADSFAEKPETILVADDSEFVLSTVVNLLKAAKFRVLQANDGTDAQNIAVKYDGEIDLLLSDVQMPGMTGPELGISLKKVRPAMRVMLMSGLPGEGLPGDLPMLNYGWAFIQKPFMPKKLIEMVNAVLHSSDSS